MSGRHSDLGRDTIRDRHPEDLVPGGILLARTTPGPLTRNHGATLEDLATPDAPRLGPLDRARQALHPDRAVAAQRLGQFEFGRRLGEPQVGVEPAAWQVHAHVDADVDGCQRQTHLPVTSLSLSLSALGVVQMTEAADPGLRVPRPRGEPAGLVARPVYLEVEHRWCRRPRTAPQPFRWPWP